MIQKRNQFKKIFLIVVETKNYFIITFSNLIKYINFKFYPIIKNLPKNGVKFLFDFYLR
jgi:hypothetical protein